MVHTSLLKLEKDVSKSSILEAMGSVTTKVEGSEADEGNGGMKAARCIWVKPLRSGNNFDLRKKIYVWELEMDNTRVADYFRKQSEVDHFLRLVVSQFLFYIFWASFGDQPIL